MFEFLKNLFRKKPIEPICGNCLLFNRSNKTCRVVILHEGERIHLPVDAEDYCFFDQEYFDPDTGKVESLNEIQEIKFWVENEKGEKIDGNGVVKMEAPNQLFND